MDTPVRRSQDSAAKGGPPINVPCLSGRRVLLKAALADGQACPSYSRLAKRRSAITHRAMFTAQTSFLAALTAS